MPGQQAVLMGAVLVTFLGVAGIVEARTVGLTLKDSDCPEGPDRFCIEEPTLDLLDGEDLTLRVTNGGRYRHNLTFGSGAPDALRAAGMTSALEPGESASMDLAWDLLAAAAENDLATIELECGLDGHGALGERLTLHLPIADTGRRPLPGPGPLGAILALFVVALLCRRHR